MSKITCIVKIQELLDRWREMGSLKLRNGAELLVAMPDGDGCRWAHAVFPGLDHAAITLLQDQLEMNLPVCLRSFYRGCGGMSLFAGAFVLYGLRGAGFTSSDDGPEPEDLVSFHRSLSAAKWLADGAVAFASSGWDSSVYVAGMGRSEDEIVRCDRVSGRILERHLDTFTCIEARLYRLDELAM